jgi:hypothetical protein
MATGTTTARRAGVTAVHSLHRFVFTVPDLAVATRFYQSFGLDVRTRIAGGRSSRRRDARSCNT